MERQTDSLLSLLTKKPLGLRHTPYANQTELSLFSWSVCVCVWGVGVPRDLGLGGRGGDLPFPPTPSGALGEFTVQRFLGYRPCRLRGQTWAHMVPIEGANKRQAGAMTQGDPLLG